MVRCCCTCNLALPSPPHPQLLLLVPLIRITKNTEKTEIIHWFWCYESISFTKGYHCLCLCLFALYLQEFVTLLKKNPVLPESNIEIRIFDGMIQIQIQLLLTEITVTFSFSFIPTEICYTVSKLRGYRCLFFSFYTYKNLLQCYNYKNLLQWLFQSHISSSFGNSRLFQSHHWIAKTPPRAYLLPYYKAIFQSSEVTVAFSFRFIPTKICYNVTITKICYNGFSRAI